MNNTMTARQLDAFETLVQGVGLTGIVVALRQSVERKTQGVTIPVDHPERDHIIECWRDFLCGLDGAVEAATEIESLERAERQETA